MFDDRNLLELIDLPPYGSFPLRGLGNVSDVEQPVREVEAVASIRQDQHGLSAPIGGIHAVHYLDGTTREVFVLLNGDFSDNLDSAVFLKPGRKTDQLSEVRRLMISDPQDTVPQSLKDRLFFYEQKRNEATATLMHG